MPFEIEIKSEKDNPLLRRREIEFILSHSAEGTPSRHAVRKKLSALLNVDLDKVYIRKIQPIMGREESKGFACIYQDKETALRIEPQYIIKRNQIEEQQEEKTEEAA
ncbi:MAG: 30S ribosomal protein S24e [Candidatus Odinarchaeia archaeon]